MRKILLFIITMSVLASGVSTAVARSDKKNIRVTDIELVHQDDVVTVTFRFHTGNKVTGNTESLVVNPVLRNGGNQLQLPSVVVRGKRARVTKAQQDRATGQQNYGQTPYYTANGRSLTYRVAVPYQEWMRGAELSMTGVSLERNSMTNMNIGIVADNVLYVDQVEEIVVVEVPREALPETTTTTPAVRSGTSVADQMAGRFSFIVPIAEYDKALEAPAGGLFDYSMPLNLGGATVSPQQNRDERIIDSSRQGAMKIQFTEASTTIVRELGTNNTMLVDLISAIRAIETSDDSRIVRVVVSGFASPDGSPERNDRLAWERANAAKNFLTANSSIKPELINVYNGSVDWKGLRALVAESNMPEKYRIMDIIDNVPVWDAYRNVGRNGELMRLNGGEPYRHMRRYFFPQLSQAAYVKIYYENNVR